MNWKTGAALPALLLAACGGGGAANTAGANASAGAGDARPAPPAPDLDGARALVVRIYEPYTRGEMPELDAFYSAQLQLAVDRQSDPETGLGYDPFCRCQDFGNFSYRIESVEPQPGGAIARVTVDNLGRRHDVLLLLDHRDGRWLVGDVREGIRSLRAGGL